MESACMILKRNTRNSCYGKHKFSNAKYYRYETVLVIRSEMPTAQVRRRKTQSLLWKQNGIANKIGRFGAYALHSQNIHRIRKFHVNCFFFRKRITSCRTWTSLCVSISVTHRVSNESDVLATESALSSSVWIGAFNAATQNPTYTSKSLASWWTNEYIYLPMLFDIFEYFFMPFFLQLIHSECT